MSVEAKRVVFINPEVGRLYYGIIGLYAGKTMPDCINSWIRMVTKEGIPGGRVHGLAQLFDTPTEPLGAEQILILNKIFGV